MPLPQRIVVCTAIAVTIFYLLYRKRRKPIQVQCKEKHETLANLTDIVRAPHYAPECIVDLAYDPYIEFRDNFCLIVPKITLHQNAYLLQPIQSYHKSHMSVGSLLPASSEINSNGMSATKSLEVSQALEILETSLDSGSEQALTSDSNTSAISPELPVRLNLPPGCFNDPIHDIYEDSPEELNGTMIPKVLIPSEMWAEAVDQDIWHETFCVPAHMGGVLIGRLGKNVRELKNIWQAEFSLNTCPGRQDTLVFKLSCPVKHKDEVLRWVSRRFRMRPSKTPIGNPNQLKRFLPLGEAIPVHVRSLYASKEFFVTVQDEEYTKYLQMQNEMDKDYFSLNNFRMQLCEPVTSGTVAVVPHAQGFARALILSVYSTWPKTVFYFLLDHGTFGVVALNKLRKIRAKYMHTPFQAIHVTWAHAFPVFSDIPDIHVLRTFFSHGHVYAFVVRMETCCRAAVAFGESHPPPYSNGFLDILVNACNSGLYMAVPLALYPQRQSWLNGSNIPYYPFGYSAIDYSSLVGFISENYVTSEQENERNTHENCWDVGQLNHDSEQNRTVQTQKFKESTQNHNGTFPRQSASNHQRFSRKNGSYHKSTVSLQKENQEVTRRTDKKTSAHETVSVERTDNTEPKRRPLGVRNIRGSGTSFRASVTNGRGRGHSTHFRPHDQ